MEMELPVSSLAIRRLYNVNVISIWQPTLSRGSLAVATTKAKDIEPEQATSKCSYFGQKQS